jgi:hypothetical protein
VATLVEARTQVDLRVHKVVLKVLKVVHKAVLRVVHKADLSVVLKAWADKARAQVELRAVKARVQEWVLKVDLQACKVVIKAVAEALALVTPDVVEVKIATRVAPHVVARVVCDPFI